MTGRGCLPAAGRGSSFRLLTRVVAVTGRGHAIPLSVFVTASSHGCGCFPTVCSQYGESGWRARRKLREGVVTVAVAQPPVVSEMYAAVTPLFVGSAALTFPPVVTGSGHRVG